MDLSGGFRALVRKIVGLPTDEGQPPQIDRLAMYRARVDVCAPDGSKLDVTPEDKRISPEKNVPVRTGIPGLVAIVTPGAIVMLGWDGGDPKKPYCVPAWEPGATVTKLVLKATQVFIGDEAGLTALINGVVLAGGIDPFTGATYGALGNASATVLAKKT
jgi:hypothetical protein